MPFEYMQRLYNINYPKNLSWMVFRVLCFLFLARHNEAVITSYYNELQHRKN